MTEKQIKPQSGNAFKRDLIEEMRRWMIPELKLYEEVRVGSRFVGKKRILDLVLSWRTKVLGLEVKTQQSGGTAYQKLSYAVEDAKRSPIPTFVVFSGSFIEVDVKAHLLSSGLGIEVEWSPEKGLGKGVDDLRQRIQMELGMDWLLEQENKRIF